MRYRIACYEKVKRSHRRLWVSLGILSLASVFSVQQVHAQTPSGQQQATVLVKGRVTDEAGKPVSGVSISVKGSAAGTMTDANGEYQINVHPGKKVLVFTFVGMETREMPLGANRLIDVTLTPASGQQQEVVVVGYGTQKRQAVTGAVATADLKTFEHVPENNILETVKGTVPGLMVSGTNKAGQVAPITVRGANTINGLTTAPLLVVDGAIFRGTLDDIAPADIASFTVLKDAAAAAIYGSRSANGVILIETKRGSGVNGKPRFNVNLNYGNANQLKPLKVYNGPAYLQRVLDIRTDNYQVADPTKIATYLQPIEQANYNATANHTPTLSNPYSLFNQNGQSVNATASVGNKTDKTEYYISGNVIKQKGVILNDLYNHYSLRARISSDLTSWFNFGVNAYYSLQDYPGATIYGTSGGSSSSSPYWFSPYASVKNPDGSYNQFPQTTTSFNNPFWQVPNQVFDRRNNLNGILTAVVKVPWVKGLSYNLTTSITQNWTESGDFYGFQTVTGQGKNGSGDMNYSRSTTKLIDQVVKYNRTFGDHSFDVTLLYSTEDYMLLGDTTHSENFNDPSLGVYGLSKGQIQTVKTAGTQTAAVGEMARLTYSYQGKYSVTGTVRRDGYSAFSADNKYGVFPSVGVNWNISREKFMDQLTAINYLALRASYGSNGNQSVSPYGTLSQMANSSYFYNTGVFVPTEYVNNLGNTDLKWEYTQGTNLGLDFGLLHNRISGAIDVYSKQTHNLLFPLSLPTTSGFTSITSNLGSLGNKGVELQLNTVNIQKGDFSWRSGFAFSLNRGKLLSAYPPNPITGVMPSLVSQNLFVGKSLGTIYDYKVIGMWQASDSAKGAIMTGMRPGTYKLLDVNHDGKITSDSDKVFQGDVNPSYTWSFTNTVSYKDFSLMVYIYSVWGGNGHYLSKDNTPYNDPYANMAYMNHAVYDYWTPTHTNAMFPRTNYVTAVPYRGVKYFDRSFIKLQKLSLAYNLTKYVKRYGINGMNVSVSADNILTYAPHWKGLDPETNSGLTDGAIPSIRTVMAGVNVNF
jgi:TonB-linked SusC/RagA family outer membrane protein